MGARAALTYEDWIAAYDVFADTVSDTAFSDVVLTTAEMFHANDGKGPVRSAKTQKVLLGLMCAHVAMLLFGTSAQKASASSGQVGRVSSASEGSVSVSMDFPTASTASEAWYLQTQYGATYWALSAPYRTMRFVGAPRRTFDPVMGFGRRR